jgi:glyoxylate reductase
VSLHVPLTPQTRYRIGAKELAWMKKGAILVNTARGPVVDEKALGEALREHRLFAAGLDVYEHEPALTEGLADLPNAVLLPHVGSATTVSREGMAILAAANIRGILAGYPPIENLDETLDEFLSPGPMPKACPSLLNYRNLKTR